MIEFLGFVSLILLSAFNAMVCAEYFEEKKYFRFGLYLTLTIIVIALTVKITVFK